MVLGCAAMPGPEVPFVLNSRLAADTLPAGRLALSHVLVMNDSRYPWLVLVPALAGLRELHDLGAADRTRLMEEIARASRALHDLCRPDKINVGAIGNIVPQLHVHVIARRTGDAAWPAPVWGVGQAVPYGAAEAAEIRDRIAAALALDPMD